VSGIILGPSEHILPRVIKDGLSKDVPNLIFRKKRGKELYCGALQHIDIDFSGIDIDYSLLCNIESSQGVSYLWKADCHLAGSKRCYFCGRMELGKEVRPANRVWRELSGVKDKWGIETFYNVADSIGTSIRDLQQFVSMRPADLKETVHRCFINANEVNEESMRCLSRLNAIAAIGIESYALFDKVGKKKASVKINEKAVSELNKNEIPMALSFVLGLPGETEGTLTATENYIEYIVNTYPMVKTVEISPLMVTSGSRAYRDLMEKTGKYFYSLCPPYDSTEMSKKYFDSCCKVSRLYTLETIAKLARRIINNRLKIRVDVKGISQDEGVRLFSDTIFTNFGQLHRKAMMVY
jgi:hypothetical protein